MEVAGRVALRVSWWLEQGEKVVSEDVRGRLMGEYYIWRIALVSYAQDETGECGRIANVVW